MSIEQRLEERLKYKPFFKSEDELQLFLRLPISEENRTQYLDKLANEHKNGGDKHDSDTKTNGDGQEGGI
jgi:hypothetical protein